MRERIAADVLAAGAGPVVAARSGSSGQIMKLGGLGEFAAEFEEQRAILAAIAKALGLKPVPRSPIARAGF